MGYSVKYSTTSAMKEYDALEKALRSIRQLESLKLINKLIRNVVSQSKEPKYRKLRLSNERINKALVQVDGCMDALYEMGWESQQIDGEEMLVLPLEVKIQFATVQKIESAIDHCEKETQTKI